MDTATRDTPKSLRARIATLIRMDNRSFGEALNRAVVEQLRDAAAASGKSYWEIADESGISRATLARLLTTNDSAVRQSELRVAYIYSICRALGIDIVGLFSRAEQRVLDQRGD